MGKVRFLDFSKRFYFAARVGDIDYEDCFEMVYCLKQRIHRAVNIDTNKAMRIDPERVRLCYDNFNGSPRISIMDQDNRRELYAIRSVVDINKCLVTFNFSAFSCKRPMRRLQFYLDFMHAPISDDGDESSKTKRSAISLLQKHNSVARHIERVRRLRERAERRELAREMKCTGLVDYRETVVQWEPYNEDDTPKVADILLKEHEDESDDDEEEEEEAEESDEIRLTPPPADLLVPTVTPDSPLKQLTIDPFMGLTHDE